MAPLFYIALLLSLPLIFTFAYLPFAPSPLHLVRWENNNGDINMVYGFAPLWAVSAVASGLWLIMCFSFKPIAKLMFHPDQMTDKPKPFYTCGTCRLDLHCVQRVPNCKRYVSITNQESYYEESK